MIPVWEAYAAVTAIGIFGAITTHIAWRQAVRWRSIARLWRELAEAAMTRDGIGGTDGIQDEK